MGLFWDNRGENVCASREHEGLQRVCQRPAATRHSDRERGPPNGAGSANGPAAVNCLNLHVENERRPLVSPYGQVGWVENARAAGGRARIKSRGRTEDVRLQELPPTQSAPILKYYAEHFKVVAPYFDAKPGDPVERFAAEADKHPVFEVLPGCPQPFAKI